MEYRRIGDLTTVITGGTPSTNVPEYWEDGNIPWLQSGCCQNCDVEYAEKCITQLGYDNSSTKMMPSDTVMIALTGATAGKIGYLKFNACGNQSITGILPCDLLDQKYLFYFLLSQRDKILTDCVGGAQAHISQGYVKDILVPVLSLVEQKAISKKMSTVDQLISLRKQQLAKLDELVKSRFIELFGDLKSNPYHWECKSLLDVATIDTVMVSDYNKYANYPHIGIDSIEKNTGRLLGYRTIAQDRVISGKYLFTPKHIIYSKIRPNLNKVAMPNFEGLCSADAYPILPNEQVCLRIYLGYVMRSEFFLEYILPFSRRANMPKVNKEQLSGFVFPVPSIEVQKQFETFVEQTDKSKFEIQKSLNQLETLKKALMQKYFG